MRVQATVCSSHRTRHLVRWFILCGGSFFIAFSGMLHVDATQSVGQQSNIFLGKNNAMNQKRNNGDIFFKQNPSSNISNIWFYPSGINLNNKGYNPKKTPSSKGSANKGNSQRTSSTSQNKQTSKLFCEHVIFCNNVAHTSFIEIRDKIEKEANKKNPSSNLIKTTLSWEQQVQLLFDTTFRSNECTLDKKEFKCYLQYIGTKIYHVTHDKNRAFERCNHKTDCIRKVLSEIAKNQGYALGTCYEPKDRHGLHCIAKNNDKRIMFFEVYYD